MASMRATPTGKIKELQERLQASNTNVTLAVKDIIVDRNSNSSIVFYTMIRDIHIYIYICRYGSVKLITKAS